MRTNGTPATARKRGKGQTPGTESLSHLAVPKLKTSTVIFSSANHTTQPAAEIGNSDDGKENQQSRLVSAAPVAASKLAEVQPSSNQRLRCPQQAKPCPKIGKQSGSSHCNSTRPASADNVLLSNSTESRSEKQVRLASTAMAKDDTTALTNCTATARQGSSIEAMQPQHAALDPLDEASLELPLACQTAINKRR